MILARIVDVYTSQPLGRASAFLVKENGTVTLVANASDDGYVLLPSPGVYRFRYVGYFEHEATISDGGEGTAWEVSLEPRVDEFGELTVIGERSKPVWPWVVLAAIILSES